MPAKASLYMETTEVPAERTASEVSAVLIQAGARQIACNYEEGKITGLHWVMQRAGKDLVFAMPARVEPVYQLLLKRAGSSAHSLDKVKLRAKAERVAWRQLLRWIQAQMAFIECGMAESTEVFFPYLQSASGETVYEYFKQHGLKELAAPSESGKPS